MIKTIRQTFAFAFLLFFSLCAAAFAGISGGGYYVFAKEARTSEANAAISAELSENSQDYDTLPAKSEKSEKPIAENRPNRPDKKVKFDGSDVQFRAVGKIGGKRGVCEILVVGDKVKNGEYVENIRIIVRDLHAREGSETVTIVPETNYGYSPQVALVNFTEKGGDEIFYTANSGGSGAFTFSYVYSLQSGSAETIFDYKTLPNDYTAEYENYYTVAVKNAASGAVYNIDISGRGEEYLGGIYNENGTLKTQTFAEVSEVNTVLPFFRGENGAYGLLILRRITGLYSADSFGYVQSFYGYGESGFRGYYEGVLINPNNPNGN